VRNHGVRGVGEVTDNDTTLGLAVVNVVTVRDCMAFDERRSLRFLDELRTELTIQEQLLFFY